MKQQIILNGLTVEELRELIVDTFREVQSHKEFKHKLESQTDKECNFFSRKELAKLLKVSLPTLHEWTKDGLLKSYRIGNRILFKECEVLQALTERNFSKFQRGGNHA